MVGNLAQWYFAAPASRSDGATASTMIFFSAGERSRCGPAAAAGALSTPAGAAAAPALFEAAAGPPAECSAPAHPDSAIPIAKAIIKAEPRACTIVHSPAEVCDQLSAPAALAAPFPSHRVFLTARRARRPSIPACFPAMEPGPGNFISTVAFQH
jgi:hypothetical protein